MTNLDDDLIKVVDYSWVDLDFGSPYKCEWLIKLMIYKIYQNLKSSVLLDQYC